VRSFVFYISHFKTLYFLSTIIVNYWM